MESPVKYHSFHAEVLTDARESGVGTVLVGQFDWGGLLLKGNEGVQRSPQHGWQSCVECKGRRGLDCEAYRPSRCESRA